MFRLVNWFGSKVNIVRIIFSLGLLFLPVICQAMPPGALVYRTSGSGKMYGYSGDPLIYAEKGIVKNVHSGHVGIYIGKENGVDYVVEALAGGIVKTPAEQFVNLAEGEVFLGAKIPKNLSAVQQAKVVAIAKSLVDKKLDYDFDFKIQKGPDSGEWTCVGVTEKIYESANISNPHNLAALEYDPNYYALDITPDGFDDRSVVNKEGDCFSEDYEFSNIARRPDLLLPAPELIGFDVGLERNGQRYIFLPYTQFLQDSLEDVVSDVSFSSSFSGEKVRGKINTVGLVLRWSLINNPLSSIKNLANRTKEAVVKVAQKVFGSGSKADEVAIVLNEKDLSLDNSETVPAKKGAVVNRASEKKVPASSASVVKEEKKVTPAVSSASEKVSKVKVTVASEKNIAETKTTASEKNAATSSSVKIASYYNPVSTPSSTPAPTYYSSGGSGGGSSAPAAESFPKIASISQIYSTGDNDWIKLYNPTDHDFDLAAATYRLEKAKTAVDPSLIMRLGDPDDGEYPGGTVIKSHDYYLIVRGSANSYFLSQADAISKRDDFSWTGSGYTIYLGTGAISSNTDDDIVEAIGFGDEATYFEGSGPAQEIVDNYVLNRVKSESDNSHDFDLIKSSDPAISWATTTEIGTTTETVATTTENISTTTENVATTTPEVASSSEVIINKIYSTGDNDWIELHNPTASDINLFTSEYRLEKVKTATDPSLIMRLGDPSDGLYPGGGIIRAGENYLIVRDDANDFYRARADAIATRTDFSWTGSGYSIYLGTGAISSSTDPEVVDIVGFGQDATYFEGSGPAPEITDNYVLERISRLGHNNQDFRLMPADDPGIVWNLNPVSSSSSTEIYAFSSLAPDLFPDPEPINSSGLEYLWHFNECHGATSLPAVGTSTLMVSSDRWLAGKFDCAQEAGSNFNHLTASLSSPLDINNFSVSFWFKSTEISPRLRISFSNNASSSIAVTLEQGMMEFTGLPNPDWRYYQDFAFDNTWRQATLVVNRNAGYWALYVDGVEKFHINSYQLLPTMNTLEIAGNNGPYAIDEVAIWSRALSPAEVLENRNFEEPFSPISWRESQKLPVLRHFWNFNEGIGTTSIDLVGDCDLTVNENAWQSLDLTNSILISSWGKEVRANFPPLQSADLSLTFWWRSPDTTTGNRSRIALHSYGNDGIFSLIPSQFTSGYKFDNIYSYFSYGANLTIPLDDNWHHLALVYDSYRYLLRFYVDGIEKGSRSFVWSYPRQLADALSIISENGLIQIDDLGIWEGALSPRQIQEIFTNN